MQLGCMFCGIELRPLHGHLYCVNKNCPRFGVPNYRLSDKEPHLEIN
jgi:hypothetical protein